MTGKNVVKMRRWYAGVTLKRLKKWQTKRGKTLSKKLQHKALKEVEDSLNELFFLQGV